MSTIVTRSGKGSPLSHVEVDANFNNLNTDKVEKTAAAITGGTINGTTIGATTPAAGTFTTITGQTEVLKGTGNNLFVQSSVLTNAAWVASNSSVTGSQTDPFGGTTGLLINDGVATGTHGIYQNLAQTIQTYTCSLYAKAGTANFVGIWSQNGSQGAFFNLTTGAFSGNIVNAPNSYTSTNTGLPTDWWRISVTFTTTSSGANNLQIFLSENGTSFSFTGTNKTVTIAAPQFEIGTTANTYIPTTTTAVYGTPTLSFSGVAGLGLESNGSLYVSPAGTGALQAQATTSTTAGGNARGANAVDWQTTRGSAAQVSSAIASNINGGANNNNASSYSTIGGGFGNTLGASNGTLICGGSSNTIGAYPSYYSAIVGGYNNTANGWANFIGAGGLNSGTSGSAVTTQSGTMNGTTAVTLSGSNANIKVGQLIQGTSINTNTYVAAISGTSLTLSQNALGSSTSTLSFYTPHGVVVGGGNNQATGSYSFIGGGGDAGTAANRNVASGDWSFVGGGRKNTASGAGSVVSGGGWDSGSVSGNTASGAASFVGSGLTNSASGYSSVIAGGFSNTSSATGSVVIGGGGNTANANYSATLGGFFGTTRSIIGNNVFAACNTPVASAVGVSQAGLLILGTQTTDATATALRSDANAASGTNQVILPNNSAYFFTGEVVSGVTGGGNTKGWTIEGVIKRGANAASTALVGTPTVTSTYADAGAATWVIAVTADTTNGGIRVTFTGQAATTIRTVCQIRTTEMTY
jgi:hypothetical protein